MKNALRIGSVLAVVAAVVPLAQQAHRPPMELTMDSANDFATTVAKLKQAVADEKFSLLFEIDLQAKLKDKGIDVDPTMVLGVCSGKLSSAIMADDIRVVSQLPCRIAVVERNGKVEVSTMNPAMLKAMYEGPNVGPVSETVEAHLRTMMGKAIAK